MDLIHENQVVAMLEAKSAECFQMVADNDIKGVATVLEMLSLNVGIDSCGNTLLHKATENQNIAMARVLIDLGFSIFAANGDGLSPLQIAYASDNQQLRRFFKQEQVTLLLFNSVCKGRLSDFTQALQNGAESGRLFKYKPFTGAHLLHYIAYYDRVELASYLLKKDNTHVNAQNLVMLETPLHIAAQFEHITIAKLLIKYGADINQADINGWTPLHRAIISSSLCVARELVKEGAKVNLQDSLGETPMHLAIKRKLYSIMPTLLHAKARCDIQNIRGETVAELARVQGIKIN